MSLLDDVFEASGGLARWRQLRTFTVHASVAGAVFAGVKKEALLKDVVVEGRHPSQVSAVNRIFKSKPFWSIVSGSRCAREPRRRRPQIMEQPAQDICYRSQVGSRPERPPDRLCLRFFDLEFRHDNLHANATGYPDRGTVAPARG